VVDAQGVPVGTLDRLLALRVVTDGADGLRTVPPAR